MEERSFCEVPQSGAASTRHAERAEQWASGIREIQEFVSTINGRRTRWPTFLVSSLITVCVIIFIVSAALTNGIRVQLENGGFESGRSKGLASTGHFSSTAEAAQEDSLNEEIHGLLSSVKSATEAENMQELIKMLDGNDPGFLDEQRANAKRLFKELEDIKISFSEVKIVPDSDDEVFVSMRVKLSGQLVRTGRPVEFPRLSQTFSLRKSESGEWKICSIE
ncbi:MAG: hypothetical protein Kow0099_38070 [Candidatus Abyssubacteria bacterium]